MENNGKRRKRGFVAAMLQLLKGAGLGCFWAWLVVSVFVFKSDEPGGALGIIHRPTLIDAWALSVGAVIGLIYAAVELAHGREP